MQICPVCNTEFKLKYRSKDVPIQHCSKRCFWISRRQEFICKSCGKSYIRSRSYRNSEYCSRECKERHPCRVCGRPILGRDKMNGRLREFCSRKCSSVFNKTISTTNYPVIGFAYHLHRFSKLQCVRCDEDDELCLCVHHKDRNHKNGDPANLEVLCYNCHIKEHKTGDSEKRPEQIRKAQFVAQHWYSFFQEPSKST